MRTRGWIAAVMVGASTAGLAFAWPMTVLTGPPDPVAEEDLLPLYREALDQRWENWIGDNFPDAERPEVGVVELLTDRERDEAYGRCLEEVGFTVTDYTSGISYSQPESLDEEVAAVGQFACDSQYPYEGQLDFLMNLEQRNALYDYYTGYLRTCLAFSGIAVTSAPVPRERFVDDSIEGPVWNPYQAVWDGGATDEEYAELERRCPSDPAWRRQVYLPFAVEG